MGRRIRLGIALTTLVAACEGSSTTSDPDAGSGDAATADAADPDARPRDGRVDDDAASEDRDAGGDASARCEPASGSESIEAACSNVHLALLRHDAEADALEVTGRVWNFPAEDPCVRLDQIELLDEGTTIHTLDAGGVQGPDDWRVRGSATSELTARCDGDSGRFRSYGIRIRGRTDGGNFVATCGPADPGTSWPPDVVATCHRGLPIGSASGNANVMEYEADVEPATDLHVGYRNERGIDIESVQSEVRIIPKTSSFSSSPTLEPFDTSGWDTSVSFSTSAEERLNVSFFTSGDPLGTDLCPDSTEDVPVFIARFRGTTGDGGSFTSEGYVDLCTRAKL